jgi:hypothetical protein
LDCVFCHRDQEEQCSRKCVREGNLVIVREREGGGERGKWRWLVIALPFRPPPDEGWIPSRDPATDFLLGVSFLFKKKKKNQKKSGAAGGRHSPCRDGPSMPLSLCPFENKLSDLVVALQKSSVDRSLDNRGGLHSTILSHKAPTVLLYSR